MPILNTRGNVEGLDGKFISNLVLQILSYVAQKEREKIKERQAQGIKSAKERGVKFGRPQVPIPEGFEEIAKQFKNKEITSEEALHLCGLTRGTFYRKMALVQ